MTQGEGGSQATSGGVQETRARSCARLLDAGLGGTRPLTWWRVQYSLPLLLKGGLVEVALGAQQHTGTRVTMQGRADGKRGSSHG
jgi:hypothetical protein